MLNLSAVDENKDIATKEYADTKALKTEAIKNITRSGTTFTATRCDNTTFTFTQQDNNSVTGVKGNSESSYRTGNVNLTAANIGAVATSGNENISGNKNFTGTTTITPSSTFSAPNNTVVNANASAIIQSPIPKYLWHDLFAFCRYAVPTYYTSTDNSTWTEATVDKRHFAQIENFTIEVLTSTVTGVRWVWHSSSFSYCGALWLALGITYKNPIAKYTIQFEYSSDGSTWNTAHLSENLQYNQQPIWLKLNGLAANPYLRLTITKATTDTGTLGLSAIKLLTTRWGDQGAGSEYEYPYVWNATPDIYPIANNTSNLGTSSYKWKNVYATTFNGSLSGTATTATNVSGAAASSNTTARHIWFSDSATETKRAYSDSCTYVSSTNTISANISGNAATATSATTLSATLSADKGGTGQTTLKDAANSLLNNLETGSSTPVDADYYISQYVGGGTTTTTYHRRPMSALWSYISGKISSVLGLTSSQYGGNAATATNASTVNNLTVQTAVPANAVFTDTKNTAGSTADANKLYLIGAKSQAANPQTYSQANAYITAGKVYSNAKEVVNLSDSQALTNKTYNGYTLGAACEANFGSSTTTFLRNDGTWATPSGGGGSGRQSTYYTTCGTTASTAAKVITISDYTPSAGDVLTVYFSTANTANAPTINLNSTGAKAIYVGSAAASSTNQLMWSAGDTLMFVYSGSYWYFVSRAKGDTFVTLYNNTTGTNGTVTLSSSAANFDHMRIYFKKSSGQNGCGSVDVYSPNGKYVNLTIFEPDSGSAYLWFASRTVYINGTSVSTYGSAVGGAIGASPSCGSNTELNIIRIEAWK